jgi:nucleoside-diphosphate-sugar epimerase
MQPLQTVLVTGSAGRIGRAAVAELLARGHRVRGFDRVPTPGLTDDVVADLTDAAAVHQAAKGVDTIVHLAATPDDADFMSQLLPGNIIGVYHIFEAAREAGVRRLILGSSGQVVWWQREHGPLTVRVDDLPSPRYWYAATKMFMEAAGRAYAETHGLSVLAIRLGWCPRTTEHAQELAAFESGPDVYLSPGDAGRFLADAVECPKPIRFAILYATSKPVKIPRFDMAPARDLIGYEARDQWPQGADQF